MQDKIHVAIKNVSEDIIFMDLDFDEIKEYVGSPTLIDLGKYCSLSNESSAFNSLNFTITGKVYFGEVIFCNFREKKIASIDDEEEFLFFFYEILKPTCRQY